MQDLIHSAGRLSDLQGDARTAALLERHERHKDNWRRTRVRRGLVSRVIARFAGGKSR